VAGLVRVSRDDVPEQHVVFDVEFAENAMNDRRARLGRAGSGQLPLGRERDPADARPSVACRFADEHDPGVVSRLQVRP
jgi:hypothetical protein